MNELLNDYPVVLTQNVLWGDMDSFQHVNNTVYLRYFEDVRIRYFENAQMIRYKDEKSVGPILASVKCDFRAPLTYPDTIQIATKVIEIADKRFTMKHVVYSEGQARIAAEGEALIVCYDYQNATSCAIPSEILVKIKAMEQ